MELGRLDVAVFREPVSGVVLRIRAQKDTTVIYLYQIAFNVELHMARVRMRRSVMSRAASRNLRYRIRIRQVFPLWRWDRAPGRCRITAEQPSKEALSTDKVGEIIISHEPLIFTGLCIAPHINYIRVVPISQNRKMNFSLTARVDSEVAS